MIKIRLVNVWLWAAALAAAKAAVDVGPLLGVPDRPDSEAVAFQALGPLVELDSEWRDNCGLTAVPRPLWCRFQYHDKPASGLDVLWPLAVARAWESKRHQRLLLGVHTDADCTDPDAAARWWLLPILFLGQDAQAREYAALFPVGGRIAEIAGFDAVAFAAFPLYLTTRRQDVVSVAFLWPVFSCTTGPDLRKWRVFPFYGVSETDSETRRFLLWPIGHTVVQKPTPQGGQRGRGAFVLPLCGWFRQLDDEDRTMFRSWTVLWPLFSGAAGAGRRQLHCPWPFIQFHTEERKNGALRKRWFWPLFGSTTKPGTEQRFVLWPLGQLWRQGSADRGRQMLWALPFYWSITEQEQGDTVAAYRRLWPLLSWEQAADQTRLRILAPWPQRHAAPIERNFAPFWTLYTYERRGEHSDHSLLWGLWRSSRGPDDARAMSLFPLFRYERSADGTDLRLLTGLFGWGRDRQRPRRRLFWGLTW